MCRGSQGDRSKASSAPRPGRDGYTTALLQEAGCVLLRKCYDIYPCTRLALQVGPGLSPHRLTPLTLLPEQCVSTAPRCVWLLLCGGSCTQLDPRAQESAKGVV